MKRQGSHPPPEGGNEGTRGPGGTDNAGDRSAPGIPSRRVRVSRLRLFGKANAGPASPCTDPPQFVRYLRYAAYVLAIAIAAAVTIKALYGATPRPEEGQVSGLYDRTGPEAVERLGADQRGLLRTRMVV